jgi:hypothetical protein
MSTVADRLDVDAEPWLPQPGDKLIGVVLELDVRQDSEYEPYPIVTVQVDEPSTEAGGAAIPLGAQRSFAFHTVAKTELERKAPKPGDLLGIAYRGRDEEKGYERYRLLVERALPRPVTPRTEEAA